MVNHRNVLLQLLVITSVGNVVGSQEPNRLLRFIVHVTKGYTSPLNNHIVVPSITVSEADDITDEGNYRKVSIQETNALLKQYQDTALEAHRETQQKSTAFSLNNKNYTVEITPIIQSLHEKSTNLKVIIEESK